MRFKNLVMLQSATKTQHETGNAAAFVSTDFEVGGRGRHIHLRYYDMNYACMPLGYCTFLSTDPKARLLTEDAHVHHSMFHVWSKEKQLFY